MNWIKVNEELKKQFSFKNQEALAEVVLKIAQHSDQVNHHADMVIVYNRLNLSITTHDEGKLTEKDHDLSKEIDKIAEEFKA